MINRMKFLKLLLPILLPFPMFAKRKTWKVRRAALMDQWKIMTLKQRNVLQQAYTYGLPYNLAESMRAICWQESSCGVNLHNTKDGSYGWFGNRSKVVAVRYYNLWPNRPTFAQYDRMANKLMLNWRFAADQCVQELNHWKNVHGKNQWSKIWASYNAGNNYHNGESYARDIMDKIKFMREVA